MLPIKQGRDESLKMMLSRTFLQSPRIALGAAALMGSAAAVGSVNKRTRLELSVEQGLGGSSTMPVVPTMEALVRASRLLKTTVLVVSEYKLAEWGLLSLEQDETEEQIFWQNETERLGAELNKAQATYADPEVSEVEDLVKRVERKEREKLHMTEIAEQLAEAEANVAEIGGSKSALHRRAANRLLDLCRQNRGVYIKIGQHLANLDYVIPPEYIECLSSLFDDTPQTPFEDVRLVIRQDLGMEPDELFDRLEPQPIASASLAQVHVAYEKGTGRKLAVKVQHAGLRETSRGDVYALTTVVRACERCLDGFTWGWIADEIAPNLPKELDFEHEGRNAETASEHLSQTGLDCVIPKILWGFTSPRVLTMEFEEGFKASDTRAIDEAGLDRAEVARLISSVFSSQAFLFGHVHCDPHPANVLLRKNKKGKPHMVLVDHGLYRRLDDDFRLKYARLWKSLMLADLPGIKSTCRSMGIDKAYTLFAAMLTARPYDEIIERSKTGSLSSGKHVGSNADKAVIRGYAQRFIREIFDLLSIIPRQMLLLLKMNDCLRHIDFSLGSPTNTIVVCGTFASRAVYENDATRSAGVKARFRAWLEHSRVMFRVRIHDTVSWFYRRRLA